MRDSKNSRLKATTPCKRCFGTGTEVVPGKGARACSCRRRQNTEKVVNLAAYRSERAGRSEQPAAQHQDRRAANTLVVERILARWYGDDTHPFAGARLYDSLLREAVTRGRICTPERAKALLPTILEICDEIDEIELDAEPAMPTARLVDALASAVGAPISEARLAAGYALVQSEQHDAGLSA